MTILEKLGRVEYLLKHQPGRHDQQKHDPYKGMASGDSLSKYVQVADDDSFAGPYHAWANNMPVFNSRAFLMYVDESYSEINSSLRNLSGQELKDYIEYNDTIERVDYELKRAPRLDQDTMVFRGAGSELSNLRPGDVYKEKAYTSTSLKESVAKDWSSGVVMRIGLPKGSRGAYIEPLSPRVGGEQEYLLPRNSRFRILGTRNEDDIMYVDAELL